MEEVNSPPEAENSEERGAAQLPQRRRILVALDPALSTGSALDVVASLASGVAIELRGLFVEDIDLLRLVDVPMVKEVCAVSGAVRPLDQIRLQRQLRNRASIVQQRFEEAARRLLARHSFEVVRGEVVEEIQRAAENADLLILSRAQRGIGSRYWFGATIHRVVLPGAGTAVVVQEVWKKGSRIVLLREPGNGRSAALALAAGLAAEEGLDLVVLEKGALSANSGADEIGLDWKRVDRRVISEMTSADLVGIATNANARALVLPRNHPQVTEELVHRLVDKLGCALILV